MKLLVPSLFITATLLVGACSTTPPPRTEGDLRGMVYDLDRQPVSEAIVHLRALDRDFETRTDIHGRFGLAAVPYGPVSLVVRQAGMEAVHWDYAFRNSTEIVYLQSASTDQLLDRAAAALQRSAWQECREYLERAKNLGGASLMLQVLEVTLLQKQGKAVEALALLQAAPPEHPSFVWEVLTGDLLVELGQPDLAKQHWSAALELREDGEVRKKWESVH